jgi:membrane protease YdiL (CAAX protease family)
MASDPDPPTDERPPPPRPRPQPNFWWSLLACVGLTVINVLTQTAVWIGSWLMLALIDGGDMQATIRADQAGFQSVLAVTPDDTEIPPMPQRLAIGMLLGMVGGNLACFIYTWILAQRVFGRNWPRTIGLRAAGASQTLIAVLIYLPGLMVTHQLLHVVLQQLAGVPFNKGLVMLQSAVVAAPLWLALVSVAVGPGLVEEIFCRGFLGRGLVGRHGWMFGVALTSVLFGALHLDPLYALGTAVMGVGLHYAAGTSRSLWVSILLHTINNGCSVLAMMVPAEWLTPASKWHSAVLYGSAAALLALGTWALWSCRAKVVPTDDNPDGWKPRFPGVAAPPPDSGLTTIEGRPNPLPLILAVVPLGGLVYTLFVH